MRKGDIRTKTIAGQQIDLAYLGRGRFCTAYQNDALVYLFVKPGDYSKHALCDPWITHRQHMPRLNQVEKQGDITVFETDFYPTLTAKYKDAWSIYCELKEQRQMSWNQHFSMNHWQFGYQVNESVIDRAEVPDTVRTALVEMNYAISNYGASYVFEFRPGNLGVDNDGNLILRDSLYDMEQIFKQRGVK